MVPQAYKGIPDAIMIAVMLGAELGLAPMQSLQNIAVISGKPSIYGDAMIALVRASGKARAIREWSEGEGDAMVCWCEATRKDDPNPVLSRFGVVDAKKAGLWGKSGPWQQYPARMLQMRARGFALRDAFADVLHGVISAEEAADIPFEATGLTPRVEPERKHDPVKANGAATETPEQREAKQTAWLDRLELDLAHAVTEGAQSVDAIVSKIDQNGARDRARGLAKDRIEGMIANAYAQTSGTETTAPNEADAEPLFANPSDDPFAERVPA
jgi:hypothetical protein